MSVPNRSSRPTGSRRRRRSIVPFREELEQRLVLSQLGLAQAGVAEPTFVIGSAPYAMPAPVTDPQQITIYGASPQQIESAYGVNQITLGSIKGDGAGQTVAIIDAFNNPAFLDSTDPNFATSALAQYDQIFGLPNPPSFTKFNEYGDTAYSSLPPNSAINGWSVEIALDIEAVHLMAPAANIDLVEANNSRYDNLLQAEQTAAKLPGVSVVTNSWGGLQFAGETAYDSDFSQPGVTFLASSGDGGANPDVPRGGVSFPATSPNVLAVGGTSLYLNSAETWSGETGWSYGSDAYAGTAASSGGIGVYEPEPAFQDGVQSTGYRNVPDVAADADPDSGLAEYDPYDFGASTPFATVGGTSLASPLFAGLMAIADQGRALDGAAPLTGNTQTLPAIYSLPSSDYHQITIGYNGYDAGAGYNLVTGLGSPKANLLIPQLAAYGLASQAVVTTEPLSSVVAGDSFGLVVSADDANGNADIDFSGTATLSLMAGPSGATFTPVTVPVTDGEAVFSGLQLSLQGSGYQFQVTIPGLATPKVTTSDVSVTGAKSGEGVFYPLPFDASLQAAIDAAADDGDARNIIELSVSTSPYLVTGGPLWIQGGSTAQTLTIVGQGQAATILSGEQSSRVFEIVAGSSSPTVVLQDLTIEDGYETDDGGLGLAGDPGVGGAILIDGGSVSLDSVALLGNEAAGAHGTIATDEPPTPGSPGGNGGAGGNAMGGAVYLGAGSLNLTDSTIDGDFAQGGAGAAGGQGGNNYYTNQGSSGSEYFGSSSVSGGAGGTAGAAGSGYGGGVYIGGGTLTITSDTFSADLADGGQGATGGFGGNMAYYAKPAGNAGDGGAGGNGAGGAVYVAGGTVSLAGSDLVDDDAVGFTGGIGGYAGHAYFELAGAASGSGVNGGNGNPGQLGANGGNAGAAGSGSGGGLYIAGGTVSLDGVGLSDDLAQGGLGLFGGNAGDGGNGGTGGAGAAGGIGGDGGNGGAAGHAGAGGDGGAAYGGGADIAGGTVKFQSVMILSNAAIGGAGGAGGFGGTGGSGGAGGNGGSGAPGGAGGNGDVGGAGGNGGAAYGGGVFVSGGSLSMVFGSVVANIAGGGDGGNGGQGGFGGAGGNGGAGGAGFIGGLGGNGGYGAVGGAGGNGGAAVGGIDVASGTVTTTKVLMSHNISVPGVSGYEGPAGAPGPGGVEGPIGSTTASSHLGVVDQALDSLGNIDSPDNTVYVGDWIAAIGSDTTVALKQRRLGTL
jgi:hypothetical protein